MSSTSVASGQRGISISVALVTNSCDEHDSYIYKLQIFILLEGSMILKWIK